MGLRHSVVLAAAAGCGFQVTSVTGDGGVPPIDAPPAVVCDQNQCRLRLDSDVDLTGSASQRDMAVELDTATPADPTKALLTPAAYVRGAVIARGSDLAHGAVGTGVDWAAIDAATVTGVSFLAPSMGRTNTAPIAVGITDDTEWTYWVEGELELPAGMVDLRIVGEDVADLQLAQPGTRAFTTIASSEAGTPQVGAFDAGAGGWFPFRAAVVQLDGGSAALVVDLALSTGGALARVPRARLRGRVDGLRGAFVVAWDDRYATGPATASLYQQPLLDDQIDQPLAPGLTGADGLQQRWFGQLRATEAGAFQLTTVSDDGNRVFLADQASTDRLGDSAANITTTMDATLRAGWNDLVVDYSELAGGERIAMTMTAAPASIATGSTIPIALLRPVMPRRNAFVTHHDPMTRAIPNNTAAGIDVTFTPDVLGGEIVREVRVGYLITHGNLSEVDVDLIHDGKTEVLRANTNSGNRWHTPTMFNAGPLAGPWTLHVDDEGGGMTGSLQNWSITIFTEGGPPQIAPVAEWISGVQDLGEMGTVTSIDELEASVILPPGATAELYVRTCATPAGCDAEAWTGPVVPGPVTVDAMRYAQLRVRLTSNGVDEPALDYVGLRYQVAP